MLDIKDGRGKEHKHMEIRDLLTEWEPIPLGVREEGMDVIEGRGLLLGSTETDERAPDDWGGEGLNSYESSHPASIHLTRWLLNNDPLVAGTATPTGPRVVLLSHLELVSGVHHGLLQTLLLILIVIRTIVLSIFGGG